MTTITTRSGKGSPLTNNEVDANFTNLNDDKVEASGDSITGNLSFGDNNKAIFGAGSDLQIWHAGDASYIGEVGTGNLIIYGDTNIDIQNAAGQKAFRAESGGPAYLYYANNLKLNTTSTGIDVTGTVTADDSITLAATPTSLDENRLIFNETPAAGSLGSRILWRNPSTGYDYASVGFTNEAGSSGGLRFKTASSVFSDSDKLRMKIADNGDISFYEDTGTTAKLVWKSADERLGIGTSSPNYKLETKDGDIAVVKLEAAAGGNAVNGIRFRVNNSANTAQSATLGMVNAETVNSWGGVLTFSTKPANSTPDESVTERMRIDSSGNLLVGKTATDNTTTGVRIAPSFISVTSGANANTAIFNRTGPNDGEIVRFQKDDVTVGSIVTNSGNIALTDGARGIAVDSTVVHATYSNGSAADNAQDLGSSSIRWKDLYLSNKVHLQYPGNSYYAKVEVDSSTNLILGAGPNGAERARIDSSGNLLVGTTSNAVHNLTSGGGFNFLNGAFLCVARQDNPPFIANRTNSDGEIQQFRKDGTVVGSISATGDDLTIGTGDTGIRFVDASDSIQPINTSTGGRRDAAVDIGVSAYRFKDLYLSGGAYLGGTSSANLLDDYEEGTFTVTLRDATSGGNTSSSTANGTYTKVGRLVTCSFNTALNNIDTTGMTGVNTLYMDLPFTKDTTVEDVGTMAYDSLDTGSINASIQNVVPETVSGSSNVLQFRFYGNNMADSVLQVQDITSGTTDFVRLTITYQAA